MVSGDSPRGERKNWWIVGIFTGAGAGLLIAAYFLSSYWQGVFVNGGTALCLFALLALSEPRLLRHLREPQSLGEALTRVAPLIGPLQNVGVTAAAGSKDYDAQIKDHVLRVIAKSGLHQDLPGPSSVHFENLAEPPRVEWDVEWDEKGIRHVVKVNGAAAPRSLGGTIDWSKKPAVHDDRIYKILCHLIRVLDPPTRR